MTESRQNTATVVTAHQMRERLASLDFGPPSARTEPPEVSRRRENLRERVVLLDYFALEAIEPALSKRGTVHAETATFVGEDCEVVTTRTEQALRLRPAVRRQTLERLGVPGALATLSADDSVKPGPKDLAHRMARRLLEGNVALKELSVDELSGMLRARDWLRTLKLSLPEESDIRRALDFANVLAPLRAVARNDFVGRSRELGMLDEFVRLEDRTAPDPLAFHGPGGVGKSALVAKYVLDRVEQDDHAMFAYLSFDRVELDPRYPLTLIREAVRQLALQAPRVLTEAAVLIRDITHQLTTDVAQHEEVGSQRALRGSDALRVSGDLAYFLSRFGDIVESASGRSPFLMWLDTFEVAQRRRRSSLAELDAALDELRRIVPTVRIVVTGRAEASELTVRQEALEGLDPTQSRAFLALAVGDLQVSSRLIEEVAARVHGNPLSLRLAAELMHREGAEVLASMRGRRLLLFGLTEERVQGILYRRILDHVDVRIRPLANPGLVVRRITPEVIADVLAGPCGLGPVSPAEASELFALLSDEVSLVTQIVPGVLVHRQDVRREMLPLLQADDPKRVERIHRSAVKYYDDRDGTDDRTEELYHRLMLGQSAATLEANWDPALAPALEPALSELPAASRVFLASRLPDAEVDAADLAAADQQEWVRQFTRQARRLLDSGQAAQVEKLVAARPGSVTASDPAVSLLLVEALASLGHRQQALAVARDAITAADAAGEPRAFVEATIVAARVAEDDGDFQQALDWFADARDTAVDIGVHTAALTAGAGVLRLVRRGASMETRGLRSLREALVAEATDLTDREKSLNPSMLRELAAELGDEVPSLLADAAEYLGVETQSERKSGLSSATRTSIDRIAEQRLHGEGDTGLLGGPSSPSGSSAAVGRAVSDAFKTAEDEELKLGLTEYWQSEADQPSYDYVRSDEGIEAKTEEVGNDSG